MNIDLVHVHVHVCKKRYILQGGAYYKAAFSRPVAYQRKHDMCTYHVTFSSDIFGLADAILGVQVP